MRNDSRVSSEGTLWTRPGVRRDERPDVLRWFRRREVSHKVVDKHPSNETVRDKILDPSVVTRFVWFEDSGTPGLGTQSRRRRPQRPVAKD